MFLGRCYIHIYIYICIYILYIIIYILCNIKLQYMDWKTCIINFIIISFNDGLMHAH